MLLPDNRGGVGPRPEKVGPLERLRLPLRLTFVVGPDEEAPLVKASRHYPTRVARHNQVANISHSLRRSELGLDEQSWLSYQRFKCSLAALVAGKERLVWEYDDPIL